MANCCVNNLGRFPHNKQIDTGLVMIESGDYVVLMTAANGNEFELNFTLEGNENIKFDVGVLNENMQYDFQIRKPDDEIYEYNDCPTFRLKTFINTQKDGCANPCDDTDTNDGPYS
jgi:hypothetical protein